jgi:hypothetical protein
MSTTTPATIQRGDRASFDQFRLRTQQLLMSSLPASDRAALLGSGPLGPWQRDRLRALLATAIDRSSFHRSRLAGVDPATFELEDLPRIPVMGKTEMMASFDEVVTDERVTRAGAERAVADATTVPRPVAHEFLVLASGGSSGERGLFVFDSPAFAEFASTLMRPAMARLGGAGGQPAAGRRIAFVAAASPIHATGCTVCMLEGGPVELDPVPVTLELDDRRAAQPAEAQPCTAISILARLAHEQMAGRLGSLLGGVDTSETLRDPLRAPSGPPSEFRSSTSTVPRRGDGAVLRHVLGQRPLRHQRHGNGRRRQLLALRRPPCS